MLRLNLLPWRARQRERRQRRFLALLAAAALVGAGLALLAGAVAAGQAARQQARNAFLVAAIADVDARILTLDALRREHAALGERSQALARLWSARSDTARILDEVAQALAPGLHFLSLTKEGGVVSAKGIAEANDRVAALMRNLGDSAWFEAPALKNIGHAPGTPYGNHAAAFEIVFEVSALASESARQTPPTIEHQPKEDAA